MCMPPASDPLTIPEGRKTRFRPARQLPSGDVILRRILASRRSVLASTEHDHGHTVAKPAPRRDGRRSRGCSLTAAPAMDDHVQQLDSFRVLVVASNRQPRCAQTRLSPRASVSRAHRAPISSQSPVRVAVDAIGARADRCRVHRTRLLYPVGSSHSKVTLRPDAGRSATC